MIPITCTTGSTKRERHDLVSVTRCAHGTLDAASRAVEKGRVHHEAPESRARALRVSADEAAHPLRRRLPGAARRDVAAIRSGQSAAPAGVAVHGAPAA